MYRILFIGTCKKIDSFSGLFSRERDVSPHGRKPVPYGANMKYNAPTHHVSPALDTMRKRSMNERKRGLDYIDSEDR
ncbi:hypothetical protein LSTR_LSTR016633 [Laodelphax striatellus]|uniref:Uncharacterized protein n=1 Tax=Laodelphax striatellus TaxID=195883 RepID=A0A482XDQ7_LAOST|nr:hypothetical protein LSTR_LSTR016633 [Laodelphax striatellus]